MKKITLLSAMALLCLFLRVNGQESFTIKGLVTDQQDRALAGATITIKGTSMIAQTDKAGKFTLKTTTSNGVLLIRYISYKNQEQPFTGNSTLKIIMESDAGNLDEVQIIGYGQTTKRLNTGSVASITAADLEKQPVTNVLSALSGRMPGVFVQTTNGLPGGNINIQIRGKGSIAAGTAPLYIVDGVPFESAVGNLNALSVLSTAAINGVSSPLNSLNPNDIESISVLKDADATSIYGSRGSNGVILITTKKGKAGKTTFNLDVAQAINQVANQPSLLNVDDYLAIRREAFSHDNKQPSNDPNSANYAPELTVYDARSNQNWANYYVGGRGHISTYQGALNGGNTQTRFTLRGNYRKESTYLPGNNSYQRGALQSSISHSTLNNKLTMLFTAQYTTDQNLLVNPSVNMAYNILLPPNYPLYNSDGTLNWYSGSNPLAELNAFSKTATQNLLGNLNISYNLASTLKWSVNAGYNQVDYKQTQVFPSTALYPGNQNYTNFGNNGHSSFIVEPQLNFNPILKDATLSLLLGATYQQKHAVGEYIKASGFSIPELMENYGSASTYTLSNSVTAYKYASLFFRGNYNWQNKYILNATLRRDASSKFGPDNRIGYFWSAGTAWLFGQENFLRHTLPFISYGKLRMSYGLTGNDQITDYQYLSTYANSGNVYLDVAGLTPQRIANGNFRWESTKKLEFAIELGFFKDRVLLNVNRFINNSSDQLVAYAIPTLTGFSSYQANLPANVENSGWELELNIKNLTRGKLNWSTTFNVTSLRNSLKSFKDLALSSYAKTLVIGEDINRVYGYRFIGLDNNGLPQYQTAQGGISGSPSSATDAYFTLGKSTPDLFGGIGNTLSYGQWSFDVFGQFAIQKSLGGLYYTPGTFTNNYTLVLDRWQNSSSETNIPKATTSTANNSRYRQSSANFFNTSYFRVKNIAIAYSLSEQVLKHLQVRRLRFYLQAQNLYTFWNKKSGLLDPESGMLNLGNKNLPPTKTFLAGIQLGL